MKQKKLDPYQRMRHERRQERERSPTFDQIFPEVESVEITCTFEDPYDSFVSNVEQKTQYYGGDTRAYFLLPCWDRECIDGGWDFEGEIRAMVNARHNSRSGQLFCQGWQDPERINKYHCHHPCNYEIRIVFR
jgi:hypothetical protein